MQDAGPTCGMHVALLCYLLSSGHLFHVSHGCTLGAVIAHRHGKHFPAPANFSRRVLICNSLGFFFLYFLALRAFVVHTQFAAVVFVLIKIQKPPSVARPLLSHSHLLQLLDFMPPRSITLRDEVQADKDVLIIHPQADNDRLRDKFTLSSTFLFFSPPHCQVVNAKKKIKKKRYINSGTVSLSSCSRSSTPSLKKKQFYFFNKVFLTFSNLIFPTRPNSRRLSYRHRP